MSDLIRDAVRYADGWEWNWDRPFCSAITKNNTALCLMEENMEQWMLDALAAQLVRQIDGMYEDERLFVDADRWMVRVERHSIGTVAHAEGPDRTDNTIRAAVEFYRSRDE